MNNKFCAVLIGAFFFILMGQIGLFAQEPETQSPESAPPVFLSKDAVRFQPANPETGDKLALIIKMSEQIPSVEVRWSVNGDHFDTVHYDGSTESVELNKPIKSGDEIEVEVIPYDLSGTPGSPVKKKVVCRKAPPTLKLLRQKVDKDTYSAAVEAKDPEDQPLSLSLEGPPGMSIDNNGAITWKITESTTGKFDVKVTATDTAGGKAVLDYSFRISRK
jgi:hypothetical protein